MTPSTLIADAPIATIDGAEQAADQGVAADELGMPSRQVMRFQTIAPISAAATIV